MPTTNCEPWLLWHPHSPSSQPRIQDYAEILDLHIATWSKPIKVWFKETREFPSSCEYNKHSFAGINRQPDLVAPRLNSMKGTLYEYVPYFGNFPTNRRHVIRITSVYIPPPLCLAIKSSTRHHRSGDETPSCGQPLDIATLLENSPYDSVVNPVFKNRSTHGVTGGVTKRAFCI